MGRAGRDCPGEYYYEEIVGSNEVRGEHDITEIERIDITNVLFRLMIKTEDFDEAVQIL